MCGRVDVHRLEDLAPRGQPGEAGHRHIVAVKRLPPADDLILRRLAALHPVLPRQAHRVVRGVGAGAGDPDAAVVAQLARRQAHDQVAQVEEGLVGEGVGRVEGELLRLVVHRLRDLRDAVADAGHDGGAARAVDVAPAVLVVEVDAFGADDDREIAIPVAVNCVDVRLGHGVSRSEEEGSEGGQADNDCRVSRLMEFVKAWRPAKNEYCVLIRLRFVDYSRNTPLTNQKRRCMIGLTFRNRFQKPSEYRT